MLRFLISKDCFTNVRRFNLHGRNIEFTIKPTPKNEVPAKWVKDAITDIVTYATGHLESSDQVGFSFCSSHFKEKGPGWMPFKEASTVVVDDVWKVINSIFQSNAQGLNTDTFCIKVTTIKIPKGTGRQRSIKYNSFEEVCQAKRGIIVINNKDKICLVRAIVVAMAYAERAKNLNQMRKNTGKLQDSSAQKLLKDSSVNVPEDGGGIEELRQFQKHLGRNYNIVVYSYISGGRDVIFNGGNFEAVCKLNLLYHEQHYNVITSLTSAFTCVYFCETCSIPYNNKNRHRCVASCPCCQNSPPCKSDHIGILCASCNRQFRSRKCYAHHKTGGSEGVLCDRVKRCTECLKTVLLNRDHTCGEIYCKICQKHCTNDHMCFIRPDSGSPKQKDILFVFFDLETTQETLLEGSVDTKIHVPNLCVFSQCCEMCKDTDISLCARCGIREHIIKNNCIANFMQYICGIRKNFKKIICIAHNSQAFDGQFILRYILEETDIKPELIMRGSKILMLEFGNLRFIDSLNYFPMSLNKLPKAFDLGPEIKKGYFPHFFNTTENCNYVGPLPPITHYSPDTMRNEDRLKFLEWYETHNNDVFDMQKDLVAYCVSDVDILKKACLKFRAMFLRECNVCPFTEAITIASACNKMFRRNFLQPNTIAIIPRGGYRMRNVQSKIAIQWLLYESSERGIDIQHAANGQEAIIMGKRIDGYCKETKQIFEFHGCYYHGHPDCMKTNRDSPLYDDPNDTLNRRYDITVSKIQRLAGSYVVIEKWECEFRRFLSMNSTRQNTLNTHPLVFNSKLEPRDAFTGGRTGNTKLYYKTGAGEKIGYIDVCSLYPWVCKYGVFPLGHPTLYVGNEDCQKINLQHTDGLIKCTILPPEMLYNPVIPCKMNERLMFVLCRTCGETCESGDCTHNINERALNGTWVIAEIRRALSKGYMILNIVEIWKYETVQYDLESGTQGLFNKMMDKFLKMKQQASGWPSNCLSPSEKHQYIKEYKLKEGIELESEAILNNPGLRSLAKLMLNSFWGKFGQREIQPKTTIMNQSHELFNMLTNPSVLVNAVEPVNEETIVVNWEYKEEAAHPMPTVNVVIAAFVTAQARLKLYDYLDKLDNRVLYYDTDSILYISRKDLYEPATGNFLGDMVDELQVYGKGSYITEFVSGGPKNYSYKVYSPTLAKSFVICKVKGISINYETSKLVNLESMRDMILEEGPPVFVTTRSIQRTEDRNVVTKTGTKVFRPTFMKRKRIENYDSVPYGYKKKKTL